MLFTDIATHDKPLEALVELGLRTKGVQVTRGTIERYSSLLEAAIRADDGETLEGNIWQEWVNGLPEGQRFSAAVHQLAETLGASASEAAQFLAVSDAVIDHRSGTSIDEAEASLHESFRSIEPTEVQSYAHLNEESQMVQIELDRAMGARDPSRPEPSHVSEESE